MLRKCHYVALDSTLTVQNVIPILEKVKGTKLPFIGDFFKLLRVPDSKMEATRRKAASWWVTYSHNPSWGKLVSLLITCQEKEAQAMATKFLGTHAPGEACGVSSCVGMELGLHYYTYVYLVSMSMRSALHGCM